MNAVEVNKISRVFKDFSAVREVSFYIPQGEIFGLLGPNGAGKTTTIRILCGIMLPSSGSAEVLGFDVGRHPNEVKKRIGYMSQKFSLYNDLTPVENLNFYASIYDVPRKDRKARVDELIKLADLQGRETMLTHNLSGAWRQRLALACAIVHRPAMIFLDEATAGVDPVSRREFWDLIYRLAGEGVSVLATTHYMDEADYCNTIGMMYQGELVALASPERLKNDLPGTLVQIECNRPAEVVEVLENLPQVQNASVHGAQVHLTLLDAADAPDVQQALRQAGLEWSTWEVILPSLEDVFINMVSQRLASAEQLQDQKKRRIA